MVLQIVFFSLVFALSVLVFSHRRESRLAAAVISDARKWLLADTLRRRVVHVDSRNKVVDVERYFLDGAAFPT